MLYVERVFPRKLNTSMESEGKKKIYRPNFFRTTKLRGESLLSGAKRSSRRGAERKKIQISNSECESFLPRRRRDTAAAQLKQPKWKELFWEWLA